MANNLRSTKPGPKKEAGVVAAEVAVEVMVVDVVVVDTEEAAEAMEEAVEAMVAEVDVEAVDTVEDVKVVVDMAVAVMEGVEADMVGAAEVEEVEDMAVADTKHRNSYFPNNDSSSNPFGPSENLQHSTRNFVTQIIASLKLMT